MAGQPASHSLRALIAALSIAAFVSASCQQSAPPSSTAGPAEPARSAAAPVTSVTPPASGPAWTEKKITVPALGKVTAYAPSQPTTHVVLMIVGDQTAGAPASVMARRLAPQSVVVMLSHSALRKAQGSVSCWFPAGVLEQIAQAAEHQLNLPEYRSPVLVGDGPGAALVYASLALAPAGTFSGGVSLGFSPVLPTDRPLCAIHEWKSTFNAAKRTATLVKATDLKRDWFLLGGADDAAFPPATARSFVSGTAHAHYVAVPGMAHDARPPSSWGRAFDQAIAQVFAAADVKETRAAPPTASAAELERQLDALNLSLDYVWASHPRASLIFVSGDGGWRDIDQKLAAYLAPRGISVVGLSSLSYFFQKKTPQQAGADLHRIADMLAGLNQPLFVGGYSFGADVVPFMLDSWTETDRRRVSGELLVAASATASFEISILALDWVPFHTSGATSDRVADAVRRIHVPTFCLTGVQVKPEDTACLEIADIATVVKLPGDHHFNGNYDAVGAAAIAFIEKRMGT